MSRGKWMSLVGLGLIVAGPFAYILMISHSLMRSTGLPAWILMGAGAVLGVAGARLHRRRWTSILAGADIVLVALFAFGFFGLAATPSSERARTITRAPDFTLPDQDGKAVTLSAELAKGPVLLVFYRGFW